MAAAAASHVHHKNADQTVEFKGYAAFEKKGDVKAFSYNPPKLSGPPNSAGKDDFVEIEISHCGICGSDIHTIDSGWGPSNYPVIPGHEIIGTISAVGKDVAKGLKVGDRVGVGAQCGSCLNQNKDCSECEQGWQNHCRKSMIWTYNSKYEDGQLSQGGYADRVRCQSDFVFKLPENISSAEAAPLMCAGVTVFAPLQRYMTKPNMKVAVVGIGGLGHLGVMFASKLQNGTCEVTAVSHNSKKKDEALKMGAKAFLDTSDKEQLKANFRKFDFVLVTANGSDMDVGQWLTTVKLQGTMCSVGLPEEPMKIHVFQLIGAQVNVTASGIGSIQEIDDMLAFASKHNVRPIIETMPMEKVNDGIKKVRDGSVRFRVVLENPKKA